MDDESGSLSIKTVLHYFAALVPILVVAGVLMMLLAQTAALPPGEFTVVDHERSNATVDEYETVDVSATIKNTGEFTETQYVRFTLGQAETARSVTLEPGESETIWLRGVAAESLGIGETAYRIRTDDDELSTTLTVDSQRPPEFAVSDLQPTAATLANDEARITISGRIEDVGGQSGEEIVELRIANKTYYRELVALDPGESEEFVVTNLDLGWLQPGTHSYGISTANDSVQGTFNVPEPAALEVRDVDAKLGPLDSDRPGTVSVTVENTGDLATEETVDLVVRGETLRSEPVALESGESTRVVFEEINASRLGIGAHQYHLQVGDATASGTWVIEGNEPASFNITSLEQKSITAAEEGSFDTVATIENTGEQTGTQTVELRFREVTRYEETIVLPPGERLDFDVYNLSLAGIPPSEYEYYVITEADERTGSVLVEAETEDDGDEIGYSGGDEKPGGDGEDAERAGGDKKEGESKQDQEDVGADETKQGQEVVKGDETKQTQEDVEGDETEQEQEDVEEDETEQEQEDVEGDETKQKQEDAEGDEPEQDQEDVEEDGRENRKDNQNKQNEKKDEKGNQNKQDERENKKDNHNKQNEKDTEKDEKEEGDEDDEDERDEKEAEDDEDEDEEEDDEDEDEEEDDEDEDEE